LQLARVFLSRCEWIAPIAKSDSPVRDCARGVFPQNCVESFDGSAELERMQQGHRTIKIALRRCIARCGEVNLSHLLAVPMRMLLRHSLRGSKHQQDSCDEFVHGQDQIIAGPTTTLRMTYVENCAAVRDGPRRNYPTIADG
jgi:hypothetical protein